MATHLPYHEMLAAVYEAIRDADHPLSRYEVAHAVNRAKTPHLFKLLHDLMARGVIVRLDDVAPNGAAMFRYSLPDKIN